MFPQCLKEPPVSYSRLHCLGPWIDWREERVRYSNTRRQIAKILNSHVQTKNNWAKFVSHLFPSSISTMEVHICPICMYEFFSTPKWILSGMALKVWTWHLAPRIHTRSIIKVRKDTYLSKLLNNAFTWNVRIHIKISVDTKCNK